MTRLLKSYGFAILFFALVLCFILVDPNSINQQADLGLYKIIPVGKGALSDLSPYPVAAKLHFSFYFTVILYYLLTAFIGFLALRPLASRAQLSSLTWFFASIPPGYLLVTIWSRIVTILLPNGLAPLVIWGSLVTVAAAGLWRWRVRGGKVNWLAVIAVPILGWIAVVQDIQIGEAFLAGDGLRVYITYMAETVKSFNPSLHFPMGDLHYDEVLFNYPLIFLKPFVKSLQDVPEILYFELWRAFGKLACLFLAYALFRWQRVPTFLAGAAALYLFFGTNSLSPLYYLVTFDTFNPLAFGITAGRVLTVFLPFLLITLIELGLQKGWSRQLAFSVFSISLGISALSFHTSWYVVAFLIVYLALIGFDREPSVSELRRPKSKYWFASVSSIVLLGAYPIFAEMGRDHMKVVLPRLFLLAVLLIFFTLFAWLRTDSRSKRIFPTLVGVVLGSFLLLSSLTMKWIHLRHLLLFLIIYSVLLKFQKKLTPTGLLLKKSEALYAALTLLGICVTYSLALPVGKNHPAVVIPLLISMLAGGVFIFLNTNLTRERAVLLFQKQPRIKLVLGSLAFLVAGCSFLGNSPTKILLPKLGLKINWLPMRDVIDFNASKDYFRFMSCDSGPSHHCWSFLHFLGYYGVFLLAATVGYFILTRNSDPEKTFLRRKYLQYFALSLVIVAFGFVMSDFMWLAIRPWYLNRLTEAATYFIMITFFLTISHFGSRRSIRLVSALCLVWVVLPFLLSHRVEQWMSNFRFLWG